MARQTPVFSVRRSVSRLHSSAPRWWLFDERYSDVWLRYERWRDFRDIYLLRTRRFDMRRWLLVEIPLLCDDQVPGGIHRLRRMLIVPFKRVQTRDLGGCDEGNLSGGQSQVWRSATSFWEVAHIDDRKPPNQKSPRHRTGARTTLTSQDQCAPTILSAPLSRRRNCRPREGGFTAICHIGTTGIPSVCCRV